jgi:nitroimidazol reductase NimA-like FMN-containing flavoprotein (pyridoxamine 5'-phosphate oxidase superfamily)
MRRNPSVCFQVDHISSFRSWYSILAWGKFEELTKPSERKFVEKLFTERLAVYTLGDTVSLSRDFDHRPEIVEKRTAPVIWRIKIEELSGRFEKPGS